MNPKQSTADLHAVGSIVPQTAATAPPAANGDDRAAETAGSNDARFSIIEARVDHLEVLALNAPDLRLARVLALKAQISAGTYKVPPIQVADALLDYMRRWAA